MPDLRSFADGLKKDLHGVMESQQAKIYDVVSDAIEFSQKELEQQLDVSGFTQNIMALPEKIRIQQEKVKEASDAFDVVKGDLANAEAMLMAVISAELNEAGKARFTNDKTRQAALEIRKASDFDYQEAWGPYKAALDELDNTRFALEQLQNEFKAYQVVGNMLAARLSLMRLEV